MGAVDEVLIFIVNRIKYQNSAMFHQIVVHLVIFISSTNDHFKNRSQTMDHSLCCSSELH